MSVLRAVLRADLRRSAPGYVGVGEDQPLQMPYRPCAATTLDVFCEAGDPGVQSLHDRRFSFLSRDGDDNLTDPDRKFRPLTLTITHAALHLDRRFQGSLV